METKTKYPSAGDKLAVIERDNGFDLATCLDDGAITINSRFVLSVMRVDESTFASVVELVRRYNAYPAIHEALKRICDGLEHGMIPTGVKYAARAALAEAGVGT